MSSIVRRLGGAHRLLTVCGLILLLPLCVGCGDSATAGGDARFGGSLNHVHDILALQGVPNVLLLATHVALYRSANEGASWKQVAGGDGQPMNGLMLYKLAQSPVDPRRIYLLAIVRQAGQPAALPGLYRSDDAGLTWTLATALTALPSQSVYTIGTGAAGDGQVFALLTSLQAHALYASADGGDQWQPLPTLPTAAPTGVAGDPGVPAHLLLWSISDGLFQSSDAGRTWKPAVGVQGGIFSVSQAGRAIYANGDEGLFLSTNDGASFTLVESAYTFSRVVACPSAPDHAYALVGTAVYVSKDSGTVWAQAAPTSSHPGLLSADPSDPNVAFVAFSYPVGLQTTRDGGAHWQTLLP